MFAIVTIAGQQFKVEEGQEIFVHRLQEEEGASVSFSDVLLLDNDGSVNVGTPLISGASVNATVQKHVKGDKVIIFKKKRRKGYRKKNGHRQSFSKITIDSISASGGAKKAAPAKKAAAKGADDLKKIEGIGPKIASTLTEAGIVTFADLAKSTPEQIAEIIQGIRGNHVTDTWPAQAKLAAEGKWEELLKWQDELDGGRV